jgi:hypothetical protein
LRFSDAERRKLAVLGKQVGRKALGELATIATPDTILRWYRELVAKKYDGSGRRGPGRPRTAAEIVRLLVEMATRNTGWGYTRLRGALKNVGYPVGRNTIKRILKEHGIDPAPLRRRQYSWATFIKAHLSAITAADFFTVEVLNWAGVVRYHVFFVIDLASRRVEIAGISRSPDGLWMEQVARNLLDAGDGFLLGRKYLISLLRQERKMSFELIAAEEARRLLQPDQDPFTQRLQDPERGERPSHGHRSRWLQGSKPRDLAGFGPREIPVELNKEGSHGKHGNPAHSAPSGRSTREARK